LHLGVHRILSNLVRVAYNYSEIGTPISQIAIRYSALIDALVSVGTLIAIYTLFLVRLSRP